MRQRTLASQAEFQKYGQKNRRELFLDEMELVVPWSGLLALVRPHYVKAGNGRRPVGLEIMLRTYFVQQWFNLSDPGVEEALYESPVLQRFVGVDLGAAPAPDETTICRFRHLLEKHDLCGMMLDVVNIHLEAKGITIATGTIHCSKTRMPLSSMRLLRPRTPRASVIRRCTRRRRATSGTSG
jgi:IS5 family transposase